MTLLPTLNQSDEALLARYLHTGENLEQLLSASTGPTTDVLSLLRFLARPDIAPWLEHFRSIQAHARQQAALNTLAALLRNTTDPNTLRLAATTLLQHNRPPRSTRPQPTAGRAATTRTAPRRAVAVPTALQFQPDASNPHTSADAVTGHPDGFDPTGLPPHDHSVHHLTDQRREQLESQFHDRLESELEDRLEDQLEGQLEDQLEDQLQDQLDDELEDQLTAEAAANDPLLAAALTGDIDAINRFYLERTGALPDPTLAAALHRALAPAATPETPSTLHGPHG